MLKKCLSFCLLASALLLQSNAKAAPTDSTLVIKKTTDFKVNGEGTSPNWSGASWFDITVQNGPRQTKPGKQFPTRAKIMYSDKGIYFLFDCTDKRLTSTIMEDFGHLFNEDVVEVFLWPDTAFPLYLEYEISPLNYELAILVPNLKGGATGWKPWHYDERNKVQHETSAMGQKKSMAAVDSWKAEFFIPFSLMSPIIPTMPKSGTRWKGNFYRIDYDDAETGYYSWQKTSGSFHEYKKFGTLIFE